MSRASRWAKRVRKEGQIASWAQRSDRRSQAIEVQADPIQATYKAHPAISLDELRDARVVQGGATSTGALARIFARQGITRKRRRCARLNSRGRT